LGANARAARVRLKAQNQQLRQAAALLMEQNCAGPPILAPCKMSGIVLSVRMSRWIAAWSGGGMARDKNSSETSLPRGGSAQQTAETFLVTAATIASWMRSIDERGTNALVQTREPVNRFSEFVRYAISV
jgi:hypothetical protein